MYIAVLAVRPPGRENRIKEAPYTKVEDYVQAVAETLKRDYSDKPFAFFGHRYKTTTKSHNHVSS